MEGKPFLLIGNCPFGEECFEQFLTRRLGGKPLVRLNRPEELSSLLAEGRGGKLLLDPSAVEGALLENWAAAIPPHLILIHLQRSYRGSLLAFQQQASLSGAAALETVCEAGKGESALEGRLLALYKNDLWVRRFKHLQSCFVDLCVEHLEARFSFLCALLELDPRGEEGQELSLPSSDEGKISEVRYAFTERLEEKITLFEDRRLLLNCARYLSEECRSALDLGERGSEHPVQLEKPIDMHKLKVVLLLDIFLRKEQVLELLPSHREGGHSNVILIFSHMQYIRHLIQDPLSLERLESGRLKLWHVEEWKERLKGEYEQKRSILVHCNTVVAPAGHPLKGEIEETLDRCYSQFVSTVKESYRHCQQYFSSPHFQSRLKEIAQGKKARILIEQACSGEGLKEFSRCCAQTFKEMGHEVFIHEPCAADRMDYVVANTIEIAQFFPDLVIRTPNSYGYAPYKLIPGMPTVTPLQHLPAHLHVLEEVRREPLEPLEMLHVTEQAFVNLLVEAGVRESQVFSRLLPAEAPKGPLKRGESQNLVDVGMVQPIQPQMGLLGSIYPGGQGGRVPLAERTAISRAERTLVEELKSQGAVKHCRCQELAEPYGWGEQLESFCHEQLCLHMVNGLHQAGVEMALGGANWKKMPHLARYAVGHFSRRESYQKQFLERRIHLAIHPWNECQPVIFDGARLGAFFLVYRPPQSVRWQALPRYLKAGEHFDYFSSPRELVDKVRWYLKKPKQREEMAQRLKEVVDEKHSYESVCQDLMTHYERALREHFMTELV